MSALNTLRPLSSFARFLASALLITGALRMVIVALSADGGPPAHAPGPGGALSGDFGSAEPGGSGAPGGQGAPGSPVKMRISVDVKPDRADVYIDGVQRGRIPFLGDVSCIAGTPFVVEVRPKSGPVQRFERTCKAGTTKIE